MTTTLVILGASGDLAARLLLPALLRLDGMERLDDLRLVGAGLDDWDDDTFRNHVQERVLPTVGPQAANVWDRFSGRLAYRSSSLEADGLKVLRDEVDGPALFYLALPPGVFADAAEGLAGAGFTDESDGWRRLVIEKPFGVDLESAMNLNERLHQDWREDQIFRIDHFLGKESVQNLLVFRFANRFLEPVFNADHVDHVQITVAETLGLEGRNYYDQIGCLRDMVQNHLMQMFTFSAIEPPALLDSEVLRDHKVEVLKSTRLAADDSVSRGQYTAGHIDGADVVAYRDEPGISDHSTTETFAAVKFFVDSWRWSGVPFYLRTGKRMGATSSEIAVRFREPPTRLFEQTPLETAEPNWLVFRLEPEESIDLLVQAKRPGLEVDARTVTLHAPYAQPGEREVTAYEQLLLDALEGDHTPFLRFDEVEWAWRLLEPVLEAWRTGQPEAYAAGSDGPPGQHRILESGHAWRALTPTEIRD